MARATPNMNDPSDRSRSTTAPVGACAIVLLLTTIFILYGSLYPFEYYERSYPGGPLGYLSSTWQDWDHSGDLMSNVLLYLPFGFFSTCTLPRRLPGAVRALIATIAGVALASSIELTQFHDVGRVTSMGDVYANGIGAGIGAVAAALVGASLRWPLVGELAADPSAALLLTMFFAYRLYPYVPMIDLHKYWRAVRPMLTAPSLPYGEFSRYLVTWLFVAAIVHGLYGSRRVLLLFPLLCSAEFVGKVLIIDNTLKLDDLLSAGIAWLLWIVLLRRLPGKFGVIALIFGCMVAAERLEPFRFEALPRAFGWLPFASFMQGSIGVDIQAFCQKFYEYGGLIWLLNRTGVRLPIATLLTAGLLLVTSVAECWLPDRSAEITDAIMALVLGGAFTVLRETEQPKAAATPLQQAAAREHARLAEAVLTRRL
jgi:VanZ family protein